MTWETLTRELAARLPALAQPIEQERELWAPDEPGQDIVLGDIFVPYVLERLAERENCEEELARAFALVEDLATHSDSRLVWLAVVSILEALEDYPDLLRRADRWLGPSTEEKLPTRRWIAAHAPGPSLPA